ncbi:hypothetical protein [Kitasatospora indigofera]|uniref:hypothetical protein n=1 Tax=Kitasatospora indigofera TaxID=67307 RepID=UPI0036C39907
MDNMERFGQVLAARKLLTERYAKAGGYLGDLEAVQLVATDLKGLRRPVEGNGPVTEVELLAALALFDDVREQTDGLERVLIERARDQGVSWGQVAEAQGLKTRQSAEVRYKRLQRTRGARSVSAQRDEELHRRATQEWATKNAGRVRELAGRLIDSSGAWGQPAPPKLAASLQELAAQLAAGSEADRLFPAMTKLRYRLRPLKKQEEPAAAGPTSAAAQAAADDLAGLVDEAQGAGWAAVSARQADRLARRAARGAGTGGGL